jgi:hypothetical protein
VRESLASQSFEGGADVGALIERAAATVNHHFCSFWNCSAPTPEALHSGSLARRAFISCAGDMSSLIQDAITYTDNQQPVRLRWRNLLQQLCRADQLRYRPRARPRHSLPCRDNSGAAQDKKAGGNHRALRSAARFPHAAIECPAIAHRPDDSRNRQSLPRRMPLILISMTREPVADTSSGRTAAALWSAGLRTTPNYA